MWPRRPARGRGVRGEVDAARSPVPSERLGFHLADSSVEELPAARLVLELPSAPPVEPEPVDVVGLRLHEQDLRIVLWRDGLLPAPWVALGGHELEETASRLQVEQARMAGWPIVARPAALGERVVTEAEVAEFRSRRSSLDELRRVREQLAEVPS